MAKQTLFARKDAFWRESNDGLRWKKRGTRLSQRSFRDVEMFDGYEAYPYRHGTLNSYKLWEAVYCASAACMSDIQTMSYELQDWFLVMSKERLYEGQMVLRQTPFGDYAFCHWNSAMGDSDAQVYAFVTDVLASNEVESSIHVEELL